MNDTAKYLIACAVVVAILASAFVLNPSAKFGGADVAGTGAISSQSPSYVPWAAPIWKPPPETESMLFALQAAIGAIVIGYFIGYEKARQEFSGKKASSGTKRGV